MNKRVRVPNYEMNMHQGKRIDGRISIRDVPVHSLHFSLDIEPSHGKAAVKNNGYWTYIPDSDYIGIEEFRVKVSIPNIGVKYSTIKIDVQKKEPITRISKIIQLEDSFQLENDDEDIIKIDSIDLDVEINHKKLTKDNYSNRSILQVSGTLMYHIGYSVGIKPVKKHSYWGEDDSYEIIADKQHKIDKNRTFTMSLDVTGASIEEDEIELGSDIKYHNYDIIEGNYLLLKHYSAIDIFVDQNKKPSKDSFPDYDDYDGYNDYDDSYDGYDDYDDYDDSYDDSYDDYDDYDDNYNDYEDDTDYYEDDDPYDFDEDIDSYYDD